MSSPVRFIDTALFSINLCHFDMTNMNIVSERDGMYLRSGTFAELHHGRLDGF